MSNESPKQQTKTIINIGEYNVLQWYKYTFYIERSVLEISENRSGCDPRLGKNIKIAQKRV